MRLAKEKVICSHPFHLNQKWWGQLCRSLSNVTTVYRLLLLFIGCGVVEWLVVWQCQQKNPTNDIDTKHETEICQSIKKEIRRKGSYRAILFLKSVAIKTLENYPIKFHRLASTSKAVFTWPLSQDHNQCDKIGRFFNFLVTNVLSKVAQMFL